MSICLKKMLLIVCLSLNFSKCRNNDIDETYCFLGIYGLTNGKALGYRLQLRFSVSGDYDVKDLRCEVLRFDVNSQTFTFQLSTTFINYDGYQNTKDFQDTFSFTKLEIFKSFCNTKNDDPSRKLKIKVSRNNFDDLSQNFDPPLKSDFGRLKLNNSDINEVGMLCSFLFTKIKTTSDDRIFNSFDYDVEKADYEKNGWYMFKSTYNHILSEMNNKIII